MMWNVIDVPGQPLAVPIVPGDTHDIVDHFMIDIGRKDKPTFAAAHLERGLHEERIIIAHDD